MAGPGILDAARHARQCALVQDSVDANAGGRDGCCVGQVSFDEIDGGGDVLALAGRKIIQPTDVVSARQKRVGKMRADEARDAGDEIGSQLSEFIVFTKIELCEDCGQGIRRGEG